MIIYPKWSNRSHKAKRRKNTDEQKSHLFSIGYCECEVPQTKTMEKYCIFLPVIDQYE